MLSYNHQSFVVFIDTSRDKNNAVFSKSRVIMNPRVPVPPTNMFPKFSWGYPTSDSCMLHYDLAMGRRSKRESNCYYVLPLYTAAAAAACCFAVVEGPWCVVPQPGRRRSNPIRSSPVQKKKILFRALK